MLMMQSTSSYEEEPVEVTFVGEFHVSEQGEAVFTGKHISLAVEDKLLLADAHLTLQRGHRYGLIGQNGAGKTTFLQSLRAQIEEEDATFQVQYVGQSDAERNAVCSHTVLEYCASGNSRRAALLRELDRLENGSEDEDCASSAAAERIAERIGEIMMELEKPDGSQEQAEKLLRRLGFTPAMQAGTVSSLSGGWRARLEMARALLVRPSILFLDEPTNHLDLHAVFQLAALLRRAEGMTVVVVSHDASFLDLVATDILSIHGCALQCVAGNYAAFEEKAAEYRRFHENKYENQQKEEARQMASTRQQRTHARRTGNDKAMKQAASREKKKQERIGLYREDGKRFKLNSLKKMDAKSLRLPSRAGPIQQQRAVSISLPKRHLEAKRVSSSTAPLLELRSAALSYSRRKTDSSLLSDLDAQVFAGDRIALVGKNGAGKSTLLRALAGDAAPAVIVRGEVRRPSGSKVALVDQNQLALLEGHLQESCAEFLLQRHGGAALVSLMSGGESGASQEEAVRKHLGRFGLGGDLALLPISALSGGLRVRLVLADVFAEEVPPDVLLLDEPTNHLDGETIAALVEALKTFPGAVLAVSHNCAFLLEVFKDLWICENGTLTVQKETEGRPFVDNFRTYAERYTPKSAKQVLQDMLRIRAARSALVVQQASTATSLLIS